MSKYHDDPTVNEYRIIVLLGKVWVYARKRKLNVRDISSIVDTISKSSMVGVCKNKFWTLCSNFTMIQRLTSAESSFYWDKFECMRKKKRILGKEIGKMDLRGRESVGTCGKSKKWPTTSPFIFSVLDLGLLFTLLFFFYHLI